MDANNEFTEENGIADLILVVQDRKIPVSKAVLCIASPVFRAMLKGDFKEKTKTEIPLPGKKYEDFVEFLRCIYPDKTKKVKEKTVYMLLPLAHEYNVGKMVKRCQKVLMQVVMNNYTNDVEELYRHISLSETYTLEELKQKCIYLASEHTLQQFKAAKENHIITDASHYKIIETALRRHELHRADETNIVVCTDKPYNIYGNSEYYVKIQFTGNVAINLENEAEYLKVLRLTERLQTKNADPNFKGLLLKKIQKHYDKGELQEQFDLLPENIKSTLEL